MDCKQSNTQTFLYHNLFLLLFFSIFIVTQARVAKKNLKQMKQEAERKIIHTAKRLFTLIIGDAVMRDVLFTFNLGIRLR